MTRSFLGRLGSMGDWMLGRIGAMRQRRRQTDMGRIVVLDDECLVRQLSDTATVALAAEPQQTETQTESAVETTCVSV